MIKTFGWESKIKDELAARRKDELSEAKRWYQYTLVNINVKYVGSVKLRRGQIADVQSQSFIVPLMVMIGTFGCYVRSSTTYVVLELTILFGRRWF